MLYRNRIALIQKEEERAKKKIEQTKERANEILSLRNDSEKRVKAYTNATGEVKQLQQVLLAKNRQQEVAGRQARAQRIEMLQSKKREEVSEMIMEKKYLTQLMIEEQEKIIQQKQKRREEIRRMEEEMKAKKEEERREKERRTKEFYEKRVAEEAAEAKRAEKLVKALERKEREWIERLREAQTVQENAFEQLESALTAKDYSASGPRSSYGTSGGKGSQKGTPNGRSPTGGFEVDDAAASFSTMNVADKRQQQTGSSGGGRDSVGRRMPGAIGQSRQPSSRGNSSRGSGGVRSVVKKPVATGARESIR